METIFTPSTQPVLNCILSNLDIDKIEPLRKSLNTAAIINADELLTNVNNKIFYLSLSISFYNSEGANRILGYYTTAGNIVYVHATLATVQSLVTNANFLYNKIAFNLALANVATTLNFIGYKIYLK